MIHFVVRMERYSQISWDLTFFYTIILIDHFSGIVESFKFLFLSLNLGILRSVYLLEFLFRLNWLFNFFSWNNCYLSYLIIIHLFHKIILWGLCLLFGLIIFTLFLLLFDLLLMILLFWLVKLLLWLLLNHWMISIINLCQLLL